MPQVFIRESGDLENSIRDLFNTDKTVPYNRASRGGYNYTPNPSGYGSGSESFPSLPMIGAMSRAEVGSVMPLRDPYPGNITSLPLGIPLTPGTNYSNPNFAEPTSPVFNLKADHGDNMPAPNPYIGNRGSSLPGSPGLVNAYRREMSAIPIPTYQREVSGDYVGDVIKGFERARQAMGLPIAPTTAKGGAIFQDLFNNVAGAIRGQAEREGRANEFDRQIYGERMKTPKDIADLTSEEFKNDMAIPTNKSTIESQQASARLHIAQAKGINQQLDEEGIPSEDSTGKPFTKSQEARLKRLDAQIGKVQATIKLYQNDPDLDLIGKEEAYKTLNRLNEQYNRLMGFKEQSNDSGSIRFNKETGQYERVK